MGPAVLPQRSKAMRRMESELQINKLHGLLTVKKDLRAVQPCQPTHIVVHHPDQQAVEAEHETIQLT